MLMDLRHLLRHVRRSPASAAAAVLTLSLTLGAGTAIFAVVDAVVLTPPPFPDPDALAMLGEHLPDDPASAPRAISFATLDAWRDRARSLAVIEGFDGTNLTLTELGPAERVSVSDVTPGFLPLLGLAPARGRTFAAEDIGRRVAIVSAAFWRTKLAADPGAVGRDIVLGGRRHTVVGVLSDRVEVAFNGADVWRPLARPAQDGLGAARLNAVARLAPHASPRDLEAALDEVSRRAAPPAHAVATPMAMAINGAARRTLGLLAGAAALACLVAFVNLAGLLLMRAVDRRRELAVRTALGARRSEIVRQLALEAVTLVVVGLAGGVLLAWWLTPAVGALALEQFGPIANRDLAVSWRAIGAVTTAAAACAGLCGVLPAIVITRHEAIDVLSRRTTAAPRELRVRRAFVAAVVALACVLLVSLTLVGRSLRHVLDTDPGFDAGGVLALQVSLPPATYAGDAQLAAFYRTLQRALEERLGTGTISLINEVPLTGAGGRRLVRARPTDPGREAVVREAGPAYFDVMRIPVVAGRTFDARDDATSPPRVLVSASLASRLFAGEQPLGRRIAVFGPNAPTAEIVGVVGDVAHRALDDAAVFPTVYLPAWRTPSRSMIVVVRSAQPDTVVVDAVRETVARLDRELPVYRVRSMRDVAAASPGVPARRVLTATFFGFALLAVVLAGIGLYGVIAHDVAARRAELALRMAVGADPARILLRTLGQGASMVAAGLLAGGILSVWAARALGGLVIASARFDLASIAVAAGVLVAVGGIAVLPAALRAARTDPLMALRGE